MCSCDVQAWECLSESPNLHVRGIPEGFLQETMMFELIFCLEQGQVQGPWGMGSLGCQKCGYVRSVLLS